MHHSSGAQLTQLASLAAINHPMKNVWGRKTKAQKQETSQKSSSRNGERPPNLISNAPHFVEGKNTHTKQQGSLSPEQVDKQQEEGMGSL